MKISNLITSALLLLSASTVAFAKDPSIVKSVSGGGATCDNYYNFFGENAIKLRDKFLTTELAGEAGSKVVQSIREISCNANGICVGGAYQDNSPTSLGSKSNELISILKSFRQIQEMTEIKGVLVLSVNSPDNTQVWFCEKGQRLSLEQINK